jgi:LysR family cyn operon transcriptional activator
VSEFVASHPAVRITFEYVVGRAIGAKIAAGELDLGIGDRPPEASGLAFAPLYDEELALVVARDHPLAGRRRMRLVELHRERLVMPTRDMPVRDVLEAGLATAGAAPDIVAELGTIDAILALVRGGRAAAVLSRNSLERRDDLRVVRLTEPTPKRTVGFLWRATEAPSASARALAAIVRRTVQAARGRGWPRIEPYFPAPAESGL